ncbi:flagellin [Sulfuriflexus sp.]|uniref:flagellin N-terminal helical domain-containing protein n=1 Tax=Sulfuriflexus sp. TaxID=2015443 RepID=UPI0028CC13B1|nr:flagellin [Sulfuriflexus sp.]MDT8404481.1 flagellin [Sulfuriflexus sp.]
MPQIINTNIASLNSQRNLNKSQSDLGVSLQRLSSGLRINSAKDDAAGLAISERFTTQIRGINQAVRNSNDGISLAQTAEGDLAQITNNLQRIRELAVQSANATNSSSDRAALQLEASQLISEIDRVASTSAFNGVKLLDGNFSSQQFQVGANAGETVNITSIGSARTDALGQANVATDIGAATLSATGLSAGDLLVNGTDVGAVANPGAAGSLSADIAAAITAADSAVTVAVGSSSFAVGAFAAVSDAATNDDGAYDLTVEGVSVINVTDIGATGSTVAAADVDNALALTSVTDALTAAGVSFTGTAAGGDLTFTKADGSNLNLTETRTIGTGGTPALTGDGFANLGTGTATGSAEAYGALTLTSSSDIVIAGAAPANAGLGAGTQAAALTGTTITNTDISTVAGANAALTSADAALTAINSSRASLGAIQNRFESVVSSLSTSVENLSAARSRIRDADFAQETAALTRNQILQQAGVSILSQANALPQLALSLLQ